MHHEYDTNKPIDILGTHISQISTINPQSLLIATLSPFCLCVRDILPGCQPWELAPITERNVDNSQGGVISKARSIYSVPETKR